MNNLLLEEGPTKCYKRPTGAYLKLYQRKERIKKDLDGINVK